MKNLIRIFLLIILILSFYWFTSSKQPKQELISKKAYSFKLSGPKSTFVALDDYSNKIRLVDFWATWCQPCILEIPSLVQLQEEFGNQGFQLIGLNVNENPEQVVPAFLQKYPLNYPVAYSNEETIQGFGGFNSLPTAFLIDRKGYIVQSFFGFTSHEVFRSAIFDLLQKSPRD